MSLLGQLGFPDLMSRDWVLRTTPPWSTGVTALLLLGAGVLIFWLYLRETGVTPRHRRILLAVLRLILVALILFMIHGATVCPYRVDLPDLVLLLDNSASMSLTDVQDRVANDASTELRAGEPAVNARSRWDRTLDLLLASDARWLRDLRAKYRVQLRTLDGSPLSAQGDLQQLAGQLRRVHPTAPASRLGAALQGILEAQRGRSTAAIVVLTDGNTTDGPTLSEAAAQAGRRRIPVFPLGVGRRRPPPDVALADLLVDQVAFVNDVVTFDVVVSASGLAGRTVRLSLRRDDEGGELASENVTLPTDDSVRRVRLLHRPQQPGRTSYVVQANRLAEESRSDNNLLRAVVQVRDESIRVLLVQSVPSFEYRYLKSLMSREPRGDSARHDSIVHLTTVLQEADPEYSDTDRSARSAFPWEPGELRHYDVLIWGDVNPELLSSSTLQDVVDFVKRDGHGMVIMAGPMFVPRAFTDTPLEQLLPFRLTDLPVDPATGAAGQLQLTPLGTSASHLQLAADPDENLKVWNRLPPFYWFLPIGRIRPGVRVLARCSSDDQLAGDPRPLICLEYVGAGKVVFHATDETHRWRYREGDRWFARYWLQTIRYLSRGKLTENRSTQLQVEHDRYELGDPVRLRASFLDDRLAPVADEGVSVLLQTDRGRQQRVSLQRLRNERGQFEAVLPPLNAGDYHAWIVEPVQEGEAPSCDFTVSSGSPELRHLTMDERDLLRTARRSEGHFCTLENAAWLKKNLPPGRAVRVESLDPIPLWNSWVTAMLFVAILVAEWLLRRRWGMS